MIPPIIRPFFPLAFCSASLFRTISCCCILCWKKSGAFWRKLDGWTGAWAAILEARERPPKARVMEFSFLSSGSGEEEIIGACGALKASPVFGAKVLGCSTPRPFPTWCPSVSFGFIFLHFGLLSFSLCLDYILFFDFVAVISIATFHARDELTLRHAHPILILCNILKAPRTVVTRPIRIIWRQLAMMSSLNKSGMPRESLIAKSELRRILMIAATQQRRDC